MEPAKKSASIHGCLELPPTCFTSPALLIGDDVTPKADERGAMAPSSTFPSTVNRNSTPKDDYLQDSYGDNLRSLPAFGLLQQQQNNRSRCNSQCSLFSDGAESDCQEIMSAIRPFSAGGSTTAVVDSNHNEHSLTNSRIEYLRNSHNQHNQQHRPAATRGATPELDAPPSSHRGRAMTISVPAAWNRRQALRVSTCTATNVRRATSGARATIANLFPDETPPPLRAIDSVFDYHRKAGKKVQTEQVMSKHSLKGKLSKFQGLLDKASEMVKMGDEVGILEGARMVTKVMINAWMSPKIGRDLAYGLCDYLRKMGYLDAFLDLFLSDESQQPVKQACGRVLEECLSGPNRRYLSSSGNRLERLVHEIKQCKEGDAQRTAVSILEDMFKDSPQTNARLLDLAALDFTLNACQANSCSHSSDNARTLRHAARALANLAMNSDHNCQQRMIDKKVPDWLFLLASSHDDVTRYYACLAVCTLVANKEIESAVIKSGTLTLVEPFLLAHQPQQFASFDYKHCQGRPAEWLAKLVPILNAKRREPRAIAAFHLTMEAIIKKEQEMLHVFEQIGAIEALKQVAALPEEVAPRFASQALEIIGEEVPYKLSQQVPLWSMADVQYWVTQIGFESYAAAFGEQKVDGDLLLLLTDDELARDIGMGSGLMRKRFMRELDSLKIAADYSCIDERNMDRFLASVDPRFSIYTYKLLDLGIDCSTLFTLGEDILKNDCGVSNVVHRQKLIQSVQGCTDMEDIELAILSKQIDVFISYRRSTGSQLASLLKVLLQLLGYKVFIDIDRLYAGKFDCSLLKNVQAAKHFILVLTPHALDRCIDEEEVEGSEDWVHKEIACAVQHNKNIIPILDPEFDWPDESRLPADIRVITRFNGVRWVHEYQDACIAKLEKFITGEINAHILPKPGFSDRPLVRSWFSVGPNGYEWDEKAALLGSPRSRSNTNEHLPKSPTALAPPGLLQPNGSEQYRR